MNGWWNRFVGDDIFGSGKTKINLRNFSPEEQYQIASAYDGTAQSLKIKAQEIQTAKNKGK